MTTTILTPRYQLPQDIVAVDNSILYAKLIVTPFTNLNTQIATVGTPQITPSAQGVGFGFNSTSYLNCGSVIADSGGANSPNANFTLSVTFTILANIGNDGIISIGDTYNSGSPVVLLYNQSGNLRCLTTDGAYIDIGAPVLGALNTFELTWEDSPSVSAKFYMNGVLFATSSAYKFWSLHNLYIGSSFFAAVGGGSVIYRAVLSQGINTDVGFALVKNISDNPAYIYQKQRRQRPSTSAVIATYTMSNATFVPGSITGTGVQAQVDLTVA